MLLIMHFGKKKEIYILEQNYIFFMKFIKMQIEKL